MTPIGGFEEKSDDEKWRDHFVLPIAEEMKRRGIGELHIIMKGGKAAYELLPENRTDNEQKFHLTP